jgi:hypothetical protein
VYFSGQTRGVDDHLLDNVIDSNYVHLAFRTKATDPFTYLGPACITRINERRVPVGKLASDNELAHYKARVDFPLNEAIHRLPSERGAGSYKRALVRHVLGYTGKLNVFRYIINIQLVNEESQRLTVDDKEKSQDNNKEGTTKPESGVDATTQDNVTSESQLEGAVNETNNTEPHSNDTLSRKRSILGVIQNNELPEGLVPQKRQKLFERTRDVRPNLRDIVYMGASSEEMASGYARCAVCKFVTPVDAMQVAHIYPRSLCKTIDGLIEAKADHVSNLLPMCIVCHKLTEGDRCQARMSWNDCGLIVIDSSSR